MDLEKLILCVQSRKPLWDQTCKEYHNRVIVKKKWEEVAKEMEETSVTVRGKWRNLRDTFRREFAKIQRSRSGDPATSSKKIKWAYFDLMLFVKDTLSARPSTANIPRDEENEGQNEVDNEGNNNENSDEFDNEGQFDEDKPTQKDEIETSAGFRTPAREKIVKEHRSKLQRKTKGPKDVYERLINIEQKKLETFSAKNALSNDSNYHFLMSLLPLMQALPPVRNMQMRLNIQQLFLNDQYQNTPPNTISTPVPSPSDTHSSTSTVRSSTDSTTQHTDTLLPPVPYQDSSSLTQELENVARYFHTFK